MKNLQQGKVPPHSEKLEETVLGSILIDFKCLDEVVQIFKFNSDVFYKTKNQHIYTAILNLYEEGVEIDLITVSQQLKKQKHLDKIGGDYYLVQLTQKLSSSAHIETHCRLMQQFYIKRQMIKKSDEIIKMAYDDSFDSIDLLEKDFRLTEKINDVVFSSKQTQTYADSLRDVAKRVELLSNQKENEFSGITTGFNVVNKFTGGWQDSDLIIIAGRPAMGKTALMLKNAVECGKQNIPAIIFSLEMSSTQLAARTIAINSNFHLSQLIRDGFEKEKYFNSLSSKLDKMKDFPLYIEDEAGMDIHDIISKARIYKRKHNIKIIFVDYLQLIRDRTKQNNREQEIASIARNLKLIAKELQIPVIALSQLSRAVETRTDKRPKLSDLRESGAIEQDADIVTFLYRHEYYHPDGDLDQWLIDKGANSEFSFAKYRQGSLSTIGLHFDQNKVRYEDPEEVIENIDNQNTEEVAY